MKINIKNFTLLLVFFVFSGVLLAQEGRRERIKTLRTGFFTQQLKLSSADAEKFWPVYNEYDEKIYNLRKIEREEIWKIFKDENDELTDSQAEELLVKLQHLREEEFRIKEETEKKLVEIFNAKMVLLLKKTEFDFNKHLLEHSKE